MAGQFSNIGTVSAKDPIGTVVTASNPDNYFGVHGAIAIVTMTNGTDNDAGPGPAVLAGSTVNWTYVVSNTGNVALRVPNSAIPLAVVQAARIPITATSANLSGESECTTADAVREQLGVRIPIIVDGGTSPRDVASTIVDLTDEEARWKVLREGAIPSHEISEFFAQG